MTDPRTTTPPSAFITAWLARLAASGMSGLALDVGAGSGRHAIPAAAAGFRVVAIDLQLDRLRAAGATARAAGVELSLVCADLEVFPLPESRFQLIVCTRYLDRPRFPALLRALAPGGVLLYETFTEAQKRLGRGPQSPEHLLKPGELPQLVAGLELLFSEEVQAPEAVARVAARRRGGISG
jgi:SAM-dependent methyltransferase